MRCRHSMPITQSKGLKMDIYTNTKASAPTIEAGGVLFIGDPHQSSRTPGRRTDECFYKTVANKIRQAIRIAEERNLVPVVLGDFFDRDDDTDAGMLVETMNALKTTGHTPWTLVGNHEKRKTLLTNDTALAVVLESGLLKRFPDQGFGFCLKSIGMEGKEMTTWFGGSAYDQPVPMDITPWKTNDEDVVWLTHHDWVFEGSYPNAMKPHEIRGCFLLVNGHIHGTKPIKRVGQTTYVNPGNITRMSVDLRHAAPRVWMFKPGSVTLFPFPLEHKKESFDLSGRMVSIDLTETSDKPTTQSEFVSLLSLEMDGAEHATQDGAKFLERMTVASKEQGWEPSVQEKLAELFQRVRFEEEDLK